MDRRFITIIIVFGFFMILVGQVRIMLKHMNPPPSDPLMSAIEEHLAKEDELSGIKGKIGGSLFGKVPGGSSSSDKEGLIAPSQGAPEGYRPYAVTKKPPAPTPAPTAPAPLPTLDNEPEDDNPGGFKPAPSYYPTPTGR